MKNKTIRFSLLLFGDSNVGKSSLITQFVDKTFNEYHCSTVGIDFKQITININDNLITLNLYDTAGQEQFNSVTQNYFKHSDGFLLVYNVSNKKSFDNLSYWLKELNIYRNTNNTILLRNGIDISDNIQVSLEDSLKFAETHSLKHIDTSAKTGEGVNTAFEYITKILLENLDNSTLVDKNHYYISDYIPSIPTSYCSC